MITAYVVNTTNGRPTLDYIGCSETVEKVKDDIHKFWNEDAGPQTFLLFDEADQVVGVMTRESRHMRPRPDDEIALGWFPYHILPAQRTQKHRCRYTEEGCQVTEIGA